MKNNKKSDRVFHYTLYRLWYVSKIIDNSKFTDPSILKWQLNREPLKNHQMQIKVLQRLGMYH